MKKRNEKQAVLYLHTKSPVFTLVSSFSKLVIFAIIGSFVCGLCCFAAVVIVIAVV